MPKPGGLLSELGGMKDEVGGSPSDSNSHKQGGLPQSVPSRSSDGCTIVRLGDGLAEGDHTGTALHLLNAIPGADPVKTTTSCREGDGTNGMVWASGKLMAQALTSSYGLRFLASFVDNLRNDGRIEGRIRCLELGTGLGVCGLALAHSLACYCRRTVDAEATDEKALACTVLLTDRGDDAVALLRENIRRNLPDGPLKQCVTVAAESLAWGDDLRGTSGTDKKFHLILGSDLLSDTRTSYQPLVATIKNRLLPGEGVVFLAVRWRKPDLEREFFRSAEREGLRFELWDEFVEDRSSGARGRRRCALGWKEYGNPESERSNEYFHDATVIVGNTKMSLANITEKDVERMDDEAYAAYEELQVQIYVGKFDRELKSNSNPSPPPPSSSSPAHIPAPPISPKTDQTGHPSQTAPTATAIALEGPTRKKPPLLSSGTSEASVAGASGSRFSATTSSVALSPKSTIVSLIKSCSGVANPSTFTASRLPSE
ncbi:hypothetical protein ACHAWF_009667 [Thalassiosira exigua]